MNKKGIFSGLLAVAAVALIAATILVSSAETRQISSANFSEQALESKHELFNARYLLDKTLSDALVDSVPVTNCDNEHPNYNVSIVCAAINDYFANTKEKYLSKNCSYSPEGQCFTGGGAEVTIEKTITCSGNSVEIKLEKTVQTIVVGGLCTLKIIDKQSGIVEATRVLE